jgi:hypothetical protein
MKNKLFIAVAILILTATQSFAGFFVSGMVDLPLGIGYNLGYTVNLTPLIEVGGEYSSGSLTGDYKDSGTGNNVSAKLSGNRIGVVAKLNLPVIPLKLHVGSQSFKAEATGTNAQLPGVTIPFNQTVTGLYVQAGLDWKIAVVNIEPYISYMNFGSYGSAPGAGIRAGLAF